MIRDIDPNKTNVSIYKRLMIFILDTLTTFIFYIFLFLSIGNLCIKAIEKDNINTLNNIYITECNYLDLPYEKDNQYGLIQIDFNTYMDNKVNEGYSSEEAYSSYNEMDNKLLENLSKNNEYVDSYNKFYVTYNLVSILSMFVSLFIFHLLIPLFNKKHNTLGMKLFKTTLVTSKDSIIISNKQVLLRFFTLFITEYTLVYLLVNWMGLIFIVLASIFSISITKRKSSLHDLILKTEVKYLDYAYTE